MTKNIEQQSVPAENTSLLHDKDRDETQPDKEAASATITNFVLMAMLFSANHGTVVSCLSLATSQLGAVGAWQSAILYLTYTASAILGATYVVKELGSRNAILAGMGLYGIYVGCFVVATAFPEYTSQAAMTGATIGGIGAGFLWTAQGAYFAQAAKAHSNQLRQDVSKSTTHLGGLFAFIYLMEEVLMRLSSTFLIKYIDWKAVFGLYTVIAVVATIGMTMVHNYPTEESELEKESSPGVFYKITAALQLFVKDPKMKYMVGLNAAFGFAGGFLNSYVNGEVIDPQYVGAVSAWTSFVAGTMSLFFSKVSSRKGPVLIIGALCFFMVAFPFVVFPKKQSWFVLATVFTMQGIGRSTFESTLKATFADYFPQEKEGAFANIILQNGLTGSIGFVLPFVLLCNQKSTYCVPFRSGILHNVLSFELLVCITSLLAIVGYLRAAFLYKKERETIPTTVAV